MTTYRLTAKTRAGKNVLQRGERWRLLREADAVAFTAERGPWLCLECVADPRHVQWVHRRTDEDLVAVAEETNDAPDGQGAQQRPKGD